MNEEEMEVEEDEKNDGVCVYVDGWGKHNDP